MAKASPTPAGRKAGRRGGPQRGDGESPPGAGGQKGGAAQRPPIARPE